MKSKGDTGPVISELPQERDESSEPPEQPPPPSLPPLPSLPIATAQEEVDDLAPDILETVHSEDLEVQPPPSMPISPTRRAASPPPSVFVVKPPVDVPVTGAALRTSVEGEGERQEGEEVAVACVDNVDAELPQVECGGEGSSGGKGDEGVPCNDNADAELQSSASTGEQQAQNAALMESLGRERAEFVVVTRDLRAAVENAESARAAAERAHEAATDALRDTRAAAAAAATEAVAAAAAVVDEEAAATTAAGGALAAAEAKAAIAESRLHELAEQLAAVEDTTDALQTQLDEKVTALAEAQGGAVTAAEEVAVNPKP